MKLIIAPLAHEQIKDQIEYIAQHNPVAAQRVHHRLWDFIDNHIMNFPKACPRITSNPQLRQACVPDTKFVLYYAYDAAQQTITVAALWHSSQDRPHSRDTL